MSLEMHLEVDIKFNSQMHLEAVIVRVSPAVYPNNMMILPDCSTVIRGAPRLVAGAPRLVVGTPKHDTSAPRCSPGCHHTFWSSQSFRQRFQVHLKATASIQSTLGFDQPGILVRQLSDTPRGSQRHHYILLITEVGPFLVHCTSIHYQTFLRPEPTNYLLVKDDGYFSDVPSFSGHASAHSLRYSLAITRTWYQSSILGMYEMSIPTRCLR